MVDFVNVVFACPGINRLLVFFSSDIDKRVLSHLTEGFIGVDIFLICREAAMKALEEKFAAAEIKMEHLTAAINHVPQSEVGPYQNLSDNFQRLVRTKAKSDGSSVVSQSKSSMQIPLWNPVRWIYRGLLVVTYSR